MPRPPAEKASAGDVQAFLQRARAIQQFSAGRPRLVFAVDATASRQPTWDLVSELQAGMLLELTRSRHHRLEEIHRERGPSGRHQPRWWPNCR